MALGGQGSDMAVRLRLVKCRGKKQSDSGFIWVAFCARAVEAKAKDVYIDDSQDHALRRKYRADYMREEKDFRRPK